MNEISDERLIDIIKDPMKMHRKPNHDGSEIEITVAMATELLSLRSLNKRLVEAGDKLADSVSAWMTQYKPESSIVQSINRNNMRTWDALMKELEEK